MGAFIAELTKYKEAGKLQSDQFKYWCLLLDEIMPILRDLTHSHREGDWKLHISAVRRALPLLFAFGRTNYSHWVPLYYEYCIALEKKFPAIYASFNEAGFVVRHTVKCGSAVPMDQALEKEYNKSAKGEGGIIGFSRRKEAVAKWNIIKHEKAKFTNHLRELCCLTEGDEYSLHHKFSSSLIEVDEESVEQIVSYIAERNNPFDTATSKVTNIVTGKDVDTETASFLINFIKNREECYDDYRTTRLLNKTKKLFVPIQKINKTKRVSLASKKIDVKKETISAIRSNDYARLRDYSIAELLKFELTSTAFFLMKDGYLRKSTKSELAKEIEKALEVMPAVDVQRSNNETMIAIDFMAYARRVQVTKLKLATYGDFFTQLCGTFSYLSRDCSRIDIIFDLYLPESIKEYERNRRGKFDAINTNITRLDQPLPVDMNRFWSSAENKVRLQQFFIKWITETYKDQKTVYLGGSHLGDLTACLMVSGGNNKYIRLLKCDHEEADDRIMFHINQNVVVDHFQRVIVASADTDVFVCLMDHFSNWTDYDIKELWMLSGQGRSSRAIPLHQLVNTMDSTVIEVLPAVHALSGCDTTSKIGTKKSAFQTAEKSGEDYLESFGKSVLTEEMVSSAEKFLVDCLSNV